VIHTRTLSGVCCQSSGEMLLLGGGTRSLLMPGYSTSLSPPFATPLNTYGRMIVQLILFVWSFVLDLAAVSRMTGDQKDLGILLRRQRVPIL
jgi:hypothetical protein